MRPKRNLKKWINPKERFQSNLKFDHVFPKPKKRTSCRCGCKKAVLAPKWYWATLDCSKNAYEYYLVLRGDSSTIRRLLYKRDQGICQSCSRACGRSNWDADHILAVAEGGGGCDLRGYQTLCKRCHAKKTKELIRRLRK